MAELKDVTLVSDDKKTLTISCDLKVNGKINEGQKFYEVLPPGVIMMWSGQGDVPDGWAVCDGEQGTPDLRGRFVMGTNEVPKDKKYVAGGNNSMIKKKNVSGSGLDMSKDEYVSEVDFPPYLALIYIMKL